MKLKTLKRKVFWEAFFVISVYWLTGTPIYVYKSWINRMNLIKEGTI